MQSIHELEVVDEIGIEQTVNAVHATDLKCSSFLYLSKIVRNIMFDILALIPQSTSVSSFLKMLRARLLTQSPSFVPIHHFLVKPYLPVALTHTLIQQPFYSSLPLPTHWMESDEDLNWRKDMHV